MTLPFIPAFPGDAAVEAEEEEFEWWARKGRRPGGRRSKGGSIDMEKLANIPEELVEAMKQKLEAETEQAKAEALRLKFEAEEQAADTERAQIVLAEKREKEEARVVDDDHSRVYRFLTGVNETPVRQCIDKLVSWSRLDPECDITIIFDSPGGSIIDGFHLFDVILDLRAKGHHVTTVAQGMAASMAGILLQAGDHRVMSAQAALLIHEASFAAMGSYGKIEDQVEFVKKLQDRILDIFAERSTLSKKKIENKWHRKDWWMLADEAKELGFCDEVRSSVVTPEDDDDS